MVLWYSELVICVVVLIPFSKFFYFLLASLFLQLAFWYSLSCYRLYSDTLPGPNFSSSIYLIMFSSRLVLSWIFLVNLSKEFWNGVVIEGVFIDSKRNFVLLWKKIKLPLLFMVDEKKCNFSLGIVQVKQPNKKCKKIKKWPEKRKGDIKARKLKAAIQAFIKDFLY